MTGFARILDDLNRAEVRYVLIGGIALICHGVVRATRDIDAVFDPDAENVNRIRSLAASWNATRPDGSPVPEDGISPSRSIHLSTEMGDLDLVSEVVAGFPFQQLSARAEVRPGLDQGHPITNDVFTTELHRRGERFSVAGVSR